MGNILRGFFKGEDSGHYRPTSDTIILQADEQPAAAPPPTYQQQLHGVAALARDLLNFESTFMVPEGLSQNVTSSRKAQVKWYYCNIWVAYKNTRPEPKTPAEAAQLVASALSWIQRNDLEGVLAFYNLPIPSPPAATASSLPQGVQFVLNTLPVNNKRIGDGDGFTAYVDTTDPRESAKVPLEVHELVIARTRARKDRDYKTADALRRRLEAAGYRIRSISGREILARTYRIRIRGIDAPELEMPYGEESKSALVNLIGGRSVTIYVYGQDQYERYVGDIYCDNEFIQEQMLKSGHAHHYEKYDKRPEFAKWEREARAANRGLWTLPNPEKPWDWKRDHAMRK